MTGFTEQLPAHQRPALLWPHNIPSLIEARLPQLFLLYAIPFVLFLSVIMPPFQVADELAHMQRADQISRGGLISHQLGGTIDGSWVTFGQLYGSMWFHPPVKQTVALARDAGAIRWSGPKTDVNFQNTAQYGPSLYLPQVAGILFGRLTRLTLARTLVVARVFNGLAACLIGFCALRICRGGRLLLFATLLLPMTMSQFGSGSADALLISLSLFLVALVSRVLFERRPASTAEFCLFALIVTATTVARPPQLVLALLAPALTTWRDAGWKVKAFIAAVALTIVVVWMRVLAHLIPPLPQDLSPSGQLQLLVSNPLMLPTVILNSFADQGVWLFKTLVGCLGWLDTLLPDWYYGIATIILALALIGPGNRGRLLLPAALGVVTFVVLLIALCGALYLSWTPLGKPTINGMQGRYMLPVLPLLAWTIPEYRSWPMFALSRWSVCLFPLLTCIVTAQALMERYYGSWTVMHQSLAVLLLP